MLQLGTDINILKHEITHFTHKLLLGVVCITQLLLVWNPVCYLATYWAFN
jgi:hypothetical protein